MTRPITTQAALRGTVCTLALATAALCLAPSAQAQSSGSSGMSTFQAGYDGARYATATPQSGSNRDANGNRLIVDGIIQSGASSYSSQNSGVSSSYAGAGSSSGGGTVIGGATAIGNSLNVVVQGNHNTVIVNSRQTNTGNITAGTALNGTLNLGN